MRLWFVKEDKIPDLPEIRETVDGKIVKIYKDVDGKIQCIAIE